MEDNTPSDLYILNEKNKYITKEYIESTLKKYGIDHKVNNLEIFQEAMIHKSYFQHDEDYWKDKKTTNRDLEPIDDPSKAIPLQNKTYERLELVGDSVIHNTLAHYLFIRYQDKQEGFITTIRTRLEQCNTLADLTLAIGLENYILLSRCIEKNGGRDNKADIQEDVFEAFIGALYLDVPNPLKLDDNFSICKRFIMRLLEDEIDFAELVYHNKNYKDILLRYFHTEGWIHPVYGVSDKSGPDHNKQFTVYVKRKKNKDDEGIVVGYGIGSSKKKAEQLASLEALKHYKVIKDDSDSEDESYEILSDDSYELISDDED